MGMLWNMGGRPAHDKDKAWSPHVSKFQPMQPLPISISSHTVALRLSCIRATSDAQAPVIQAKNGAGQMARIEPRPATPTPSPREHSIKVASLNT